MEWGPKYPHLCLNPNIVMNKVNDELDELLNLDDIQYPTEETKELITPFKEPKATVEPCGYMGTREELIQKNKELAIQSEIILNELIVEENKWKEEKDNEKRKEFEKTIAILDEKLEVLTEEKNKTQELFELYARFDPQKETLKVDQFKEIADIDKSESQKLLIRQTIAQQRLEALAKARALKPKAAGDPTMGIVPATEAAAGKKERPVIDRATKPSGIIQRSRLFDTPLTFNVSITVVTEKRSFFKNSPIRTILQITRNISN